jgi:hypothetical protein
MTTRQEKIEYLTRNELEWLIGQETHEACELVTEFFTKGGYNTYPDEQINDLYQRITA